MIHGCCGGVSLILGAGLLVMLVLVVEKFDPLIENAVNEKLALKKDSDSLARFVDVPVNPYLQMYFFNVTNKEEFLAGSKPVLQEVGPYAYRQVWQRINVTLYPNDTIESARRKFYYFDREKSVGDESDMITILNVPFVTAVWQVRYTPRFVQLMFSSMLEVLGSQPFTTHNVSELVWGYEDPLLKMASDILPPEQRSPSDSFGFFLDKNGTVESLVTQYRGSTGDMSRFMEIQLVDRQTHLDKWASDECNRIHGSDGTSFHPFVKRNETLHVFNKGICRALPLRFLKDTEHYGIKAYRFSPPQDVFAPPLENPDNKCYCVGGPPCLGGGVFNASVCLSGSPAVVSFPHFFQADPEYLDAVEGLNPDPEKHQFYLDITPRTGTPIASAGRVQINMALTSVPEIIPATGLRPMIFPVVWFQEGVLEYPESIVSDLWMGNNLPGIAKISLITLLGSFGVVLLAGGLTLIAVVCSSSSKKKEPSGKIRGLDNPALETYPEKD